MINLSAGADLHIHTNFSDGIFSPSELLYKARKAGLSIISFTDHDTIESYHSLQNDQHIGISVIPGIEFSTEYNGEEVHILGYFFDPHNEELQETLHSLRQHRIVRFSHMVHRLHKLGYKLLDDKISTLHKNIHSLGRPHIAQALVDCGYFPSIAKVFSTVLHRNGPAYIPHKKLSIFEVLSLLKNSGGVSVLAHPGLLDSFTTLSNILHMPIHGIESIHPAHSLEQIQMYETLAKTHGLFSTGGSDFHGFPGRKPEQLGEFSIPSSWVSSIFS